MQYREVRALILLKKREAQAAYYAEIFHNITDSREFWRTLTKLEFTKAKQKLATAYFSVQELANYYAGLETKHPACTVAEIEKLLNDFPIDGSKQVFHFREVTSEQVLAALQKTCNKSRGSSPDGDSLGYFKQYLHLFVDYFTKFIEQMHLQQLLSIVLENH